MFWPTWCAARSKAASIMLRTLGCSSSRSRNAVASCAHSRGSDLEAGAVEVWIPTHTRKETTAMNDDAINPDGVSIRGCSIIYAPAGQAGEYASLASNPYRGCGNQCSYCYVPRVL